jgi:L-lactate dehydrogenase
MNITICGIGRVGSAIAFGLVLTENDFELDLIDIDKKKLCGEIADLEQAVEVLHKNIKIEIVENPRESDYYIICCGKSGSDRESLYEHNKDIILPYLEMIARVRKENSWVLMVTNPSGRLSQLAMEYTPLVIPIGNKLDNARLRLFKVISRHETPEIQDKYREVAINKGYTAFAPASECLSIIQRLNRGFDNL